MPQPTPIKDIAHVLNCAERVVRSYLRTVDSKISVDSEDPDELIPHETIVKLCRRLEGTLIYQRLCRLLGETTPLDV